jgi:hypothetical protein
MMTFHQNAGILYQELDGEGVLYEEAAETVHQLNETAYLVWTLCGEPTSHQDIVEELRSRYDVDLARVEQDVKDTLTMMTQKNILIQTELAG